MARRFVVVTSDYAGLGWAVQMQAQGENVILAAQPADDEEALDEFAQVGDGWVPKTTVEKAIAKYANGETLWIFDHNHLTDVADQLRKDGEKVFGTSALTERLEHDRAYAVQIAEASGLQAPPTEAFTDTAAALEFLDQNPEIAYVFKPDASELNYLTFVPSRDAPEDANRELFFYLRHLAGVDSFILQERKKGVEVNVELWLSKGVPFFAVATLENKRRWNQDLGEMSGCASDVVWQIPIDGPLVQATIGKMLPFYRKNKYTGFADVNVIVGDSAVWFLEVCDRFGYSAHPTLFLGLALEPIGTYLEDWVDGFDLESFPRRFRPGFAASTTCFLDHPRPGLPLHLAHRTAAQFYPFDGWKDGEDLLLAGYSGEVGIFIDHDYTIADAAENVLTKLVTLEAVSYPDIAFRTDLGSEHYQHSVRKRYAALAAMRLL